LGLGALLLAEAGATAALTSGVYLRANKQTRVEDKVKRAEDKVKRAEDKVKRAEDKVKRAEDKGWARAAGGLSRT
jgi:hypothetical protein